MSFCLNNGPGKSSGLYLSLNSLGGSNGGWGSKGLIDNIQGLSLGSSINLIAMSVHQVVWWYSSGTPSQQKLFIGA